MQLILCSTFFKKPIIHLFTEAICLYIYIWKLKKKKKKVSGVDTHYLCDNESQRSDSIEILEGVYIIKMKN